MSEVKYCQGPKCHTYQTKDRLRGPKGAKYYQTRRRSSFSYLNDNACSLNCANDWFEKFGNQAINHFGRIHEPIKLTADNAWRKIERYSWQMNNGEPQYYWWNSLTEQELPLTQEQYENSNITKPRRQIVVHVEATNSKGEITQQDTIKI